MDNMKRKKRKVFKSIHDLMPLEIKMGGIDITETGQRPKEYKIL